MITDNPHYSKRWRILAILAIAQLMVVLDVTIVNIGSSTFRVGYAGAGPGLSLPATR